MRVWWAVFVAAYAAFSVPVYGQFCQSSNGCVPFAQGDTCMGAVVDACPPPPAPPPPSLYPSPVALVTPNPGHPTFFYGGSVILKGGVYTMWVTVNDAILRFTSGDGITWVGGARVLEATKLWEDDCQGRDIFDGFQHGVSTACVLELPGGYVMGYMAGPLPNTGLQGGIGLAYSADGIDWTKDPNNPIFRNVGADSYALSAVVVNGVPYFYVSVGGAGGLPPGNYRIKLDSNGRPVGGPERLPLSYPAYPIARDASGCWMVEQFGYDPALPWQGFRLYRGGDCYSTLGTLVGTVTPAISGHVASFLPFLMNRESIGGFVGNIPIILYASGDSWATWQLHRVDFVSPRLIKRHFTAQ